MTLDFKNDNAVVFGESVKLITKSGHYTIPISPYKIALNNLTTGINTNITLNLVSAIFYQIFIFHQMIALQKVQKLFFI